MRGCIACSSISTNSRTCHPMRITGILLTACLLLRRSPRTYRSSPVTRALPTINVCAFYGIRRTCILPRRIPKTVALYQLDILGALTQTGITQTAAGGKARAFCDIVGDQIGTMETNEFLHLGETLIHYATGQSLDFLSEIFGVYRLGQQIASVSQGDTNFRFYVVGGGKFGDINSGSDINLPAGTLILDRKSVG